jgi:hypothetical protein
MGSFDIFMQMTMQFSDKDLPLIKRLLMFLAKEKTGMCCLLDLSDLFCHFSTLPEVDFRFARCGPISKVWE